MNIRSAILALGIAATLTGCQNMDSNALLGSGAEAWQAYSLSDEQVKTLSDKACQEMDAKATIAPASSEYSKRLSKIAAALGDNINGQPVNYKVYETKDVNAFAMANGCVRVMAGLMDIASDDEIRAVIGHEIGHAKLGHTKEKMRTALMTSAAREGVAASGGKAGAIAASELGGLAEAFINAQFSQKEESEADKYGYRFMVKHQYDPNAMVSMLKKLPAGGGLLSSHPSSPERAKKIEALVAKG